MDEGGDGMKGMETGGLKIQRQNLQITTVEVIICKEIRQKVMHDTRNKTTDFHKE